MKVIETKFSYKQFIEPYGIHTLKVSLCIIHKRIYAKLDIEISDNQLGFRKEMGTREALFGLSILMQRCLDIYVCFIDFEWPFVTKNL